MCITMYLKMIFTSLEIIAILYVFACLVELMLDVRKDPYK